MDCILPCVPPNSAGDEREEEFSAIGLRYLAEGAAHVVYRITSDTSLSAHPHLIGRLFRFRKSIASGFPCAQTVSNFQNRIAPLFPPDNLVDLEIYHIPDQSAWIAKLNTVLQQMEAIGTRPPQRCGIYLTSSNEERDAILVTDLSPQESGERLLEFKPKWLVQSPSAPAGAKRCRTCAVREMRTDDGKHTRQNHVGRGHAEFCPLDLLSGDDAVLEGMVNSLSLLNGAAHLHVSTYKQQIQPLLFRLRDVQAAYRDVGLKNFEDGANHDFSVSMALRDCSVFVKMKGDETDHEVRLADFDRKTTRGGKLENWTRNERRLIGEGWYTGTERADSRGQRFCSALQAL